MTWGGFNWKLNFRWYRVPQRELDRRNGDRLAHEILYMPCPPPKKKFKLLFVKES